jgi:hypothetical protein
MEQIKIRRRVSAHPEDMGFTKMLKAICPDIFETETGDFVIIGRDVTSILEPKIPADAIISKGERVVLIPRDLLVSAAENIQSK